jgi:hypothetical protein
MSLKRHMIYRLYNLPSSGHTGHLESLVAGSAVRKFISDGQRSWRVDDWKAAGYPVDERVVRFIRDFTEGE